MHSRSLLPLALALLALGALALLWPADLEAAGYSDSSGASSNGSQPSGGGGGGTVVWYDLINTDKNSLVKPGDKPGASGHAGSKKSRLDSKPRYNEARADELRKLAHTVKGARLASRKETEAISKPCRKHGKHADRCIIWYNKRHTSSSSADITWLNVLSPVPSGEIEVTADVVVGFNVKMWSYGGRGGGIGLRPEEALPG